MVYLGFFPLTTRDASSCFPATDGPHKFLVKKSDLLEVEASSICGQLAGALRILWAPVRRQHRVILRPRESQPFVDQIQHRLPVQEPS